jgi:transposase-like protein
MSENEMGGIVDTEFKANVASEVIKGDLSIEEICKNYNVTQEQALTWAEVVNKSIFGNPDAYEEVG